MRTIISLGLFKDSGGPTKTIGAFKQALDAELYCFCGSSELGAGALGVKGASSVKSASVPILNHFRYSPKKHTRQVEQTFSNSSIISCHSFYRYHALWTNMMSRKYDIPYWFVPHGILDPWVMDKGRFTKQAYLKLGGQRFLDDAKTVIFSTKAEKKKALKQFDLPGAEVIPWPVELIDRGNYDCERDRIRAELGICKNARVLLYFGRLHSMKRPIHTIDAIAAAEDDNVHLIIVGNEQDVSLEDCACRAKQKGIASRVHLIGPVYGASKYSYMFAADAYISLSYRENFNHAAAESLSAGLPALLSPGNDLQGDISEDRCSWGLTDNSMVVAVEAIREVATLKRSELLAMGMRGRDWVRRNLQFSIFKHRIDLLANKLSMKR